MMDRQQEKKEKQFLFNYYAVLLCAIAFFAGCVLVSCMGCAIDGKAHVGVQHNAVEVTTTLEAEYCSCCGYAPWSDSWCEHHFGT